MLESHEGDFKEPGVRARILCVRHGQAGTDHVWRYSPEKIKTLGLPLSKIGQQQVRKLSGYLSTFHFDHIYSSDLLRAYETAHAILEPHAYASMNIMTDIREVHAWHLDSDKNPGPDIIMDETQRLKIFAGLLGRYENAEQVLVVSHGNFIRYLLAELTGTTIERMPFFEIYNASVTSVFIDSQQRLHVQEANNTRFLDSSQITLT